MSAFVCGCDPDCRPHAHTCETFPLCPYGRTIQGFPVTTDPSQDPERRHVVASVDIRTFDTGATRNIDTSKYDYEAFINPEALHAFGAYMHAHRRQRDGSLRDGDNWQKGIPFRAYLKSLVRHAIDLWRMDRGYAVTNPDTGQPHTKQELCCALVFNALGYLKELVDPSEINKEQI